MAQTKKKAGLSPNTDDNGTKMTRTASAECEQKTDLLANQPLNDRWKSWWIRIGWSLVLVGGFIVIIAMGHLYLTLLVLLLEFGCFYEINSIAFKVNKAREAEQSKEEGVRSGSIPFFRTISLWFLFTANYFLFGKGFYNIAYVYVDSSNSTWIDKALRHHQFISFCMYIAGIVAFVLTLRKGHYRRQFSQFGWTHVSCLMVVGGASFIIGNIFEGLIWFLLPVFIVICNDCTAYIFGFFFGHTRLIELSPKKTWEGFLGAFGSTMLFAWVLSYYFAQYAYFRCPVSHTHKHGQMPTFAPMINKLDCEPDYVYIQKTYEVPEPYQLFGVTSFEAYPCQMHALILALFGSLIAPFGGFMASGFKRAFKVKDFSDLIPGHGGIMDRFDCQFLMGAFTYVYYQSFISPKLSSLPIERMSEMIAELSAERKMQLYQLLQESLSSEGRL